MAAGASSTPAEADVSGVHDCTQCKLIGGGTMLAVGGYFITQAAMLRRKPTELGNARFHGLLGALFTSMGVYRLAMPLRPENRGV